MDINKLLTLRKKGYISHNGSNKTGVWAVLKGK